MNHSLNKQVKAKYRYVVTFVRHMREIILTQPPDSITNQVRIGGE